MAYARTPIPLFLLAGLVLLVGIAIAAAGGWLAALGGSWYYLLAGIGTALVAVLLFLRRPAALNLYAVVVLGTVAWAVHEVGFDWWQLAPRGDIIFPIGILLLLPWVTRRLARQGEVASPWRRVSLPLSGALLVAAAVGVVALLTDPHDETGALPRRQAAQPLLDPAVPAADWRAYGRSGYGTRFSPVAEITPANVDGLKVAWTFHTGDIRGPKDPNETTYEVTPLKVGDTVYLCTPHDWVIALDAETGQQRWRFDPQIRESPNLQHLTCRGVSYHEAANAPDPSAACARRLFLPTADARLIALDAASGKPCADFGDGGTVNLWQGMPELQPGFYYSTSPPVVTRNLVIIAGNVSDNVSTHEPSGVVRAYDVTTGRLVWNWDSGNPEATAPIGPGEHYTRNSPNSWSVSSVDEGLGLIYIPMGNQTPDQWGANRGPNTERFASSITALDVATGKVRWVYQTVHHDLWDMDIGAQPSLVDLLIGGQTRHALVAPTKSGNIYVLDRETGQPLIPAPERPVPQGAVPSDHTAPTQPFSALSFMPQRPMAERDMWGATLFDQLACRIMFRRLRYEGVFTPPSVQGTLVYPGNFGVIDWGGIAVDPVRQVAFANPSYMAFVSRLVPRERIAPEGKHESAQEPAGGSDIQGTQETGGLNPNYGAPYAVDLHAFLSPIGLPCQAPPWGYVAGIDLSAGTIVYRHRNGTVRDEAPVPLPFKMGVPSLGGPIMTAGGVAFLTSTLDYYVRAYDVTTGRQIWEDRLPAGAQATPITYRSPQSGRQFLLVVAGGHGSLGTKAGDAVIAYALSPNAT